MFEITWVTGLFISLDLVTSSMSQSLYKTLKINMDVSNESYIRQNQVNGGHVTQMAGVKQATQ